MADAAVRTESGRSRVRAAGRGGVDREPRRESAAPGWQEGQPQPQAAEQALVRQSESLARAVHELRGPLMPILGVSALLARGGHAVEPARLASVLDRQVRHMSRLIDDLLDASRVATGTLRIERRYVDLVNLLGHVLDACRPRIEGRRQHLDVHLPDGPLAVHGDEVRLVQVFTNLLDNACKYTPREGDITLTCTREGGPDGPGMAMVTIADNGVGISAAGLATIFEPFVQEPHAVEFHAEGLGIGLCLVRELVRAHGGTVSAASAGPGLGSRFTVRLPLAAPAGP